MVGNALSVYTLKAVVTWHFEQGPNGREERFFPMPLKVNPHLPLC